MTFRSLCGQLQDGGVPNPEWDAVLLIGKYCGLSREAILSSPDLEYVDPALLEAVRRRAERYPLQYLLGEWDFYRQTYRVTPDCLIPRSETERLVERAIAALPPGAFFADLGTGSGCIAVSVLCERPDTTAVALDLSPAALSLARENAGRNRVSERLRTVCADLNDPLHAWTEGLPLPAAILSNPPYIRSDVLPTLEPELSAEPVIALDGGADGLTCYRSLIGLLNCWCAPDGFGLFEIGYDQGDALSRLAASAGWSCTIHRDYAGLDRVAELRRTNPAPGA